MITIAVNDANTGAAIPNASVQALVTALDSSNNPLPSVTDATGRMSYDVRKLAITLTISADGYGTYQDGIYRNLGPNTTIGISLQPSTIPSSGVLFDHDWFGNVENALRALLSKNITGQAAIDQLNNKGGIYAGGEFQPHHNETGYPTYGFPWFYVSLIDAPNNLSFYQIVEFGDPPAGNHGP